MVQIVSIDLALANGTLVQITPESSLHFWKAAQVSCCCCTPDMSYLSTEGLMKWVLHRLHMSKPALHTASVISRQQNANSTQGAPAGNTVIQDMMCENRGPKQRMETC